MATSPTPPSSSLPQPQSFEQLLGQALSAYAGGVGVNDLNVGAPNVAFFQIVALMVARSSGDIFQILRDYSLDRATGPALQNLALEYGVPPIGAAVATGFITVTDLSFQKISAKIYAGANPPNIGSTTIFVSDASLFPAVGAVYIGRTTVNVEGPLAYGNTSTGFTGSISLGSNIISGIASTTDMLIGFTVFGAGIPVGTTITSIDSSSQIHISTTATSSGTTFTYKTPPVLIGSFWEINLDSPTTKFHNIGETVILAQGGVRTVPVNTTVISPGIGTTPNISYNTTQQGIILDGETTVTNIPITAQLPGAAGNVPGGAISQFSGNPSGLPNASITNPLALTTGRDTETDNQLRIRVKNAKASTGLGTVTAIESALQGVQDPSSSATIVSTDILNSSANTIVYIDDGTGYEAIHQGVPIETIVNSALGGEKFFQLVTGGTQTSVTKAFLQTVAAEPFDLNGGEVLAVVVGNITFDHTFQASDFANPGSATAYEICASINADTSLNYEAVTAGGGTFVVIRPEDEKTNVIQVTTPASPSVIDANTILQFPSQKAETLRLYKNGILLTEDGTTASIFTQSQSLWSPTMASGETLSLAVDGTAPITYTLTDAMFVAEGTYTTLSSSNSLQSWVNVLNSNITGITASIVGSTIELTSNLGAVNRAEVTVVNTISNPTSLISKGLISNTDLTSTGVASDYILDRNTAQIQLDTALVKNDVLSAGTTITQANIKAESVSSGSATLTSDAHVWIAIDTNATIIPSIRGGSTLTVSKIGSNTVRYTSNSSTAFSNVIPGDYVIVWSTEIPATDDLEGRVHAVTGSTLDIKITAAEYALATPVSNANFIQGFVVVRTANVPQKFRVTAGTKTLNVIAAELQAQSDEVTFAVFDNTNITVTTNTLNTEGQITVVTADSFGALMGFVGGTNSISQDALIAFYETQAMAAELPLFFHSTISADSYAEPIDSYLTNFSSTLSMAQFDPNELISFLHPYGIVPGTLLDDEQPALETVQMSTLSGTAVTILPVYPDVRRLRVADRFYVANPLDFGYNDTVVAIVDNNTVGETYTLPLYRRAIVNSLWPANAMSFDAYDVDAGATASFATNFSTPTDFFANYKALLQAKYVLQGSNTQTALLYRSAVWGRSGQDINVSYVYPTSANQPINSAVTVTPSGEVSVLIGLISGNPISSLISSNTQWNVTVTPNTPTAGIDQVTYTYASVGTAPGLTLSGGEYVTILPSTGFNVKNTGTFRVSTAVGFTPTSTKFSVQVPTGTAIAQSGVVTGILNGILFYTAIPTTAAAINTYVNANLSKYFTTTIVNDGGTTGSGVIALSTYEDSGFTHSSYYLKDGINWIANSNVSGNPQFTFKVPLTYPSDTGYSFFTSGDEVRLVPTTMDQVKDLWNILAVTGFTTVGTIETVDRGTKLQLATNTIGSVGSIQIVGGSGNEYSVPVLTSGELLGNNEMIVSANSIASQAMMSDQWFRLQAQNFQNKDTGISANTSVTVLSNTPISGESTVTLSNQEANQLYFGSPRKNVNVEGRTFRIEKQGELACLSWDGVGTSPGFGSSVNINDTGGFTVNVSSDGTYTIATNPPPPPATLLGSAASYGILAASAITNSVGTSIVNGNLGEYPGSTVTGAFTVSGSTNLGNAAAHTAQNDALAAYTAMNVHSSTNLGYNALDGHTVTAGYYTFPSGDVHLAQSGPGTFTINGSATDVFVFQVPSTLTTGAGGVPTIALTGGALASNVYWAVGSSATINSGTAGIFNGNIIAQASITDTLGGTVNGSLIALTAAVTLSQPATISVPSYAPEPSGNPNFADLTIGDLITISGMTNPGNNGTFFVTGLSLNGLSFSVSNPLAVVETGTAIIAGAFTATSSVSEGDTMILSSPFAPLNQGQFRVIRRFNDSVWYENPKALAFPLTTDLVEEEVTCTANTVVTGFDATTVFNVIASGGTSTLSYASTGTAPTLGVVLPGDVVTFGSGFSTPNQGSFIATNSGPSQQQIVQFTMPSGATFTSSGPGEYFEIYNGGNANKYYIWYNVSGGSNTDPAPAGFTGIEVTINSSDNSTTVANETFSAITGHLTAMTSSASSNIVTITATIPAATNSPVDVSMPTAFSFTVTQLGQTSFLNVVNPAGVVQSGISSVTFSVNRPQIQFFPYDATVPGDKLVVNGTVLGAGNAGTYQVLQVLSPDTAIVSGIISQQYNTNLDGNSVSLSVQEGTKYTGYKQVAYVSAQPGTSNFNNIVFNTSAQFDKIDLSAGVAMVSLGKLNFPVTIRTGIDSYNYDTGLIGEANRVVYGDPRDAVTYPGVEAAGTDIFIREPLLRRIQIALAIRTNIGVSFAQITSQIQSSVYALIQANPLGQSIDCSSIVETVRLIPGVTSVVLTSPTYDLAQDEIQLVTGEKAFIANQITDISVSLIGS